MWASISKNVFMSILIIFIVHYLFNYFVEMFTIKKTKDLVNSQIEKYKNILQEIQINKENETVITVENELMQFANECLLNSV